MRLKAWIVLAMAGCQAAHAADRKLTPTELEQGRLYLQQTRDYIVGATKGLSEAQWKFKPGPDRWSIAEILEHIVLAQDLVLGPIQEQLARAPEAPADRDFKQVDAIVLNQIPDRLNKFPAPPPVQPTGRWTHAVASDRLLTNYGRLRELLDAPDLRQHTVEAMPLKAVSKGAFDSMDGYQWLLTVAAHTERHTKQILEVKADPRFPAK
jgi:hypothetical protein